jgi:hypothetical protein
VRQAEAFNVLPVSCLDSPSASTALGASVCSSGPHNRTILARWPRRQALSCRLAQGATGAVMIQENWDGSVEEDVIDFLNQQIPKGA